MLRLSGFERRDVAEYLDVLAAALTDLAAEEVPVAVSIGLNAASADPLDRAGDDRIGDPHLCSVFRYEIRLSVAGSRRAGIRDAHERPPTTW